jgi:methylated-DNA-protein-cysteine methyltransferase related protein
MVEQSDKDHSGTPGVTKDFFERVYEVVRRVPKGRVTTYGAIARCLGLRSSARMVGWALNAVALQDRSDIPAHRVVNRLGELSGKMHFETPYAMQERLEAEGMTFIGEAVDLKAHFWDPDATTDATS